MNMCCDQEKFRIKKIYMNYLIASNIAIVRSRLLCSKPVFSYVLECTSEDYGLNTPTATLTFTPGFLEYTTLYVQQDVFFCLICEIHVSVCIWVIPHYLR